MSDQMDPEYWLLDRFFGCWMGLAVGDAMGAPVEFLQPGEFEPVTGMTGGGKHQLQPGQWTDDTSMAYCLAESLYRKRGFSAKDQMETYLRWYEHGHLSVTGKCFDIGGTTERALLRFKATGKPFAGTKDPQEAGNGSLMRLAPIPMFYYKDALKAVEMSGKSSRTTHGAREAVDACRYFGGLVFGALHGEPKDVLLARLSHPEGPKARF